MNKKMHLRWTGKILAVILAVLLLVGNVNIPSTQVSAVEKQEEQEKQLTCSIEGHEHTDACYEETESPGTDEQKEMEAEADSDTDLQQENEVAEEKGEQRTEQGEGEEAAEQDTGKEVTAQDTSEETPAQDTSEEISTQEIDETTEEEAATETGSTASSVRRRSGPQTQTNLEGPVIVTAKKYLDGAAPGEDHTFTFELLYMGKVVDRGQSDAEGNVSIRITYLPSMAEGTYTYTIREVNDSQEGIVYDTSEQQVNVTITKVYPDETGPDYDLSEDQYYYGMTDFQEHYMSTTVGGEDIPVFCIDAQKEYPPEYSDLKTGRVVYKVIENPSNATLEQYVGEVKEAGKTEENLRKLLYYLDTEGKDMDSMDKNNYIWTVTSQYTSRDYWDPVSQRELDQIYATTVVPDNYHIALFYPYTTQGSTYSLNQYQPLIVGYYDNTPVLRAQVTQGIEFYNTTDNYSYTLPQTGGFGTTSWILGGGAMIASALYGFYYKKKREGR
jgi:pilin isopeptide linkage protein/LPXTG-motif cell wall-anchored protein